MRISRYFTDLMATYLADIDDLKTDSGGDDVLLARLKQKRAQIPSLMSMIQTNPEMMAVVFHKNIKVKKPKMIMGYINKEPADFPSWDSVSASVQFEPWATSVVEKLKTVEGGEQFLLTTVMLEHLFALYETSEHVADQDESEDTEEDEDLAESGGEWMSEHGFDSH